MKPLIIGITGGSGSGKTTFIRQLGERFEQDDICVISQDDYYFPRDMQEIDNNGVKNFDRPKSIDKKSFYKDIQKLIAGEVVERLEYTLAVNQALMVRIFLGFET